jgi:hypothetical protein
MNTEQSFAKRASFTALTISACNSSNIWVPLSSFYNGPPSYFLVYMVNRVDVARTIIIATVTRFSCKEGIKSLVNAVFFEKVWPAEANVASFFRY